MTNVPLFRKKRMSAFGLGLIAALVVTWAAWAQIGGSGTVLGCVGPSGIIKGVDEATGACRAGDMTLTWYTKEGVDAAFLSKTGKAADADLIDGVDATAFLHAGTAAGGALAGTYPNPSLASGSVGTNQIQDGSVTAQKLAFGLSRPPSVVDANGTTVGTLLDRNGTVLVADGTDRFVVNADIQGIASGGVFLYQQSNCTGTPAVATFTLNPNALLQPALVRPGEVWIPDFAAGEIQLPPGTTLWEQDFFPTGPPSPCMEATISFSLSVTPLRMVTVAGVPPLHVE